jgi:hypothetical protein
VCRIGGFSEPYAYRVPRILACYLSWKSGEIYYSDIGLVHFQSSFSLWLYVICRYPCPSLRCDPPICAIWVRHPLVHQNASITNFRTKSYTQLLHPPNMPKSSNFSEERMAKAFAAAMSQKKPNISKIAREFDVSRETLVSRVKSAKSPTSTPSI